MNASKVSLNDSVYGDPELVAKLAVLTKGKILDMRKDIPKSLILAALDDFEEDSEINVDEISEKVKNITRCTISNAEIISNLHDIEKSDYIEHLGHLKYKLKVRPNLSSFDSLSQPVWKEFETFILARHKEYDPVVHSNAKTVFDSLLLKILVRFATSKPLENQMDRIPLDDFDKIVSHEVKDNYFPDDFSNIYPSILMDYFSSESPQLLDFIFSSYCGLINFDLVLKEQDLPSIKFDSEIDFLLVDSNFIIPLLCNTDSKNPLSIALLNLCNRYNIPLYFTPKTKGEIWHTIANAKKYMSTKNSMHKGYRVENQFVTDFSRSKGTWTDYTLILSNWEEKIKERWNICELSPESAKEIDEGCYDFVLRMLPIADRFRSSYRLEKEVSYDVRLRDDRSYGHDAYCLGLISYFKQNPMSTDATKLLGPWFLTYDDLISFVNQTHLRKEDDVGYSVHPRVLLNYFLAYSKLEFNSEDKEHVAMALLRYTARPSSTAITVGEYSRIFTEQIDIGSENADVLKSILLVSPLLDRLENALESGNRDEADKIVVEVFSSEEIRTLIQEAMYSSKEKEENQQTIERLRTVILNQKKDLEENKMESNPTYTIYATDSRVNISSIDTSTNLSIINSENVFFELKNVIEKEIENLTKRNELLMQIEEMESSKGSEDFKTKYASFIASVADHITLIAPFIPALTSLFS